MKKYNLVALILLVFLIILNFDYIKGLYFATDTTTTTTAIIVTSTITTPAIVTTTLKPSVTFTISTLTTTPQITIDWDTLGRNLTRPTTTITIFPSTCNNGVLDPDEMYVDCGGPCFDCRIMEITGNFVQYRLTKYLFRYDGVERVLGGPCKKGAGWPEKASYFDGKCYEHVYYIAIKTPDGLLDYRTLNLNDTGFIDGFKFRLLEESNGILKIYVKPDPDAREVPDRVTFLSVGGKDCVSNLTGLCLRSWNNYQFQLKERGEDKAKFDVTLPSGRTLYGIWVTQRKTEKIEGIEVGLLHPYDRGGYAVIFVKEV